MAAMEDNPPVVTWSFKKYVDARIPTNGPQKSGIAMYPPIFLSIGAAMNRRASKVITNVTTFPTAKMDVNKRQISVFSVTNQPRFPAMHDDLAISNFDGPMKALPSVDHDAELQNTI
jgi:hypothetical protein